MRSIPATKCFDSVKLQFAMRDLGIPPLVRNQSVIETKRLMAPNEEQRRTEALEQMAPPKSVDVDRFCTDGGGRIDTSKLSVAAAATRDMQAFVDELRSGNRIETPTEHPNQELRTEIAKSAELMARPTIVDYVLSDEVIAVASHYFGQVPILSRLSLFWSPVNDRMAGNQQYHYDGGDSTQLKLIMYVNDIDSSSGPFTFIPAPVSEQVEATRNGDRVIGGFFDDDTVEAVTDAKNIIRTTGPAGTIVGCDTSRCLHYGARTKTGERFALFVQFTRFMSPKSLAPEWDPDVLNRALSPVQKMVLNIV